MPLDAHATPFGDRIATLNNRFVGRSPQFVLEQALQDAIFGRFAMVSSFGAESVVLLHMISRIDPNLPVLFLNTQMLFAETLDYQHDLAERLGLSNVQVIRPDRNDLLARDGDGLLHQHNPDACCSLRKTEPLQRALAGYDTWITGRKRFQGRERAALELFEYDAARRIKLNPLVFWSIGDVQNYIAENQLPRHPLVASGYLSIGCQPCTTRFANDEPARAGRWRGRPKDECGIHFDGVAPISGKRAA